MLFPLYVNCFKLILSKYPLILYVTVNFLFNLAVIRKVLVTRALLESNISCYSTLLEYLKKWLLHSTPATFLPHYSTLLE